MREGDFDAFRFPNPKEDMDEDVSMNNAAHVVIAAYEATHPEAAQTVFRQPDTQLADLIEQLRGAEHVEKPNEELYWAARELIERRNDTSHLFLGTEDQ